MKKQCVPNVFILVAVSAAMLVASGPASAQLYINELLVNGPGADAPNEYVEIRGPASSTIAAGTYLIGIEGDSSGPGDVQTIFDLSGLMIGSNGFLVLLQFSSPYSTVAGANVLTAPGPGAGFGDFTFYSADFGADDIENPSATYLLISGGTAPGLAQDIDSNDDGTPDGAVYPTWTILDGVGIIDGSAADFAYAPIVYAESGLGSAPVAGTFIDTGGTNADGVQYVARQVGSTGSAASDWVGADISGAAPNWTCEDPDTFPAMFRGAALDHIGGPNATLPVELTSFEIE